MINISAISKEYVMGDNKLLALNNVDVSINEGEFVSITVSYTHLTLPTKRIV